MTREPFPEHAAAHSLMTKLARAAGIPSIPSGQAMIKHLESLAPDAPALKFIGEAIAASVPKVSESSGHTPLSEVG